MENLENNTGAVNTETESLEETEKTYTQEEVDKLLQSETDRRVQQALKTQERKSQEKLREAQKIAAMSADEKYRYELSQREEAIAQKEYELTMSENRNECAKILNSKGLSLDLVNFCVAETAEEMDTNIKLLDRAFRTSVKQEVEKRLAAKAPTASADTFNGISKEQFKKMSLAQMQELANSEPELFAGLTK